MKLLLTFATISAWVSCWFLCPLSLPVSLSLALCRPFYDYYKIFFFFTYKFSFHFFPVGFLAYKRKNSVTDLPLLRFLFLFLLLLLPFFVIPVVVEFALASVGRFVGWVCSLFVLCHHRHASQTNQQTNKCAGGEGRWAAKTRCFYRCPTNKPSSSMSHVPCPLSHVNTRSWPKEANLTVFLLLFTFFFQWHFHVSATPIVAGWLILYVE